MNATVAPVDRRKAELRRDLRARRKGLADRNDRSERITGSLRRLEVVRAARRVLLFASLPGEPAMEALDRWLVDRGCSTTVPEEHPDPSWPDLVVVPGVAFSRTGDRLGQGGGWYDRFLARTGPTCVLVGVAFDFQVVDDVPVEFHDVALHAVVTDQRIWWSTRHGSGQPRSSRRGPA